MISPKIKLCGIRSVSDAMSAVAAGIDVLGLVFFHDSPRYVSMQVAADIARHVPPFTCLVGLFVNAPKQYIASVLEQVPLSLLQFHGNETEPECSCWHKPYIKAFRVQQRYSIVDTVAPYHSSSGYLLDSYNPKIEGGTGESFNWNLVPKGLDKPIILAGGLNASNIRTAIKTVQPYAVDVSSGVESSPGVKDIDKITAFVEAVGNI